MNELTKKYFNKMKRMEEKLITFLEKQDNFDENFNFFNDYITITENKYEMKSFLYLLNALSNYHYRYDNFFTKIKQILTIFKEKLQNDFTSFEIFHIFQNSKQLLLYLFNSGIIVPNQSIFDIISSTKYKNRQYLAYFYPEFENYLSEEEKRTIQSQVIEIKEKKIDEFNSKRNEGENDNYICYLIRNDLVIDFITYLERTNISVTSTINQSIYETNLYLTNKNPSLIEYSAFFGSIQIFTYLNHRNSPIENTIWPYAIHGKNAEIIHFLEENKIETISNTYQYLLVESIKCHHDEIFDYLRTNFCVNEKIHASYLNRKSLKYYNFRYFKDEIIDSLINQNDNIPYYLSKYDYYVIVDYLCKIENFDVNYLYSIYKPSNEQNDIVYRIKIQNKDINQKTEEDEIFERLYPKMFKRLQEEKKYSQYQFDEVTSTILHVAIEKGNNDIIQLLLNIHSINLNVKSVLYLKKKVDPEDNYIQYYVIKKEKSILNIAVESGYIEIVQFLLKLRILDVNEKEVKITEYYDFGSTSHKYYNEINEKSLLHIAIIKGYLEIVKLLVKKISINQKSTSKIKEAGGCYVYCRFERYIEKSSLYYAVKKEHAKLIQWLIKNTNLNVNFGIKEIYSDYKTRRKLLQEKTPLYITVEKQNIEIIQILLNHPKIKVNFISTIMKKKDFNQEIVKNTALQLAIELENNEIIQLLSKETRNFFYVIPFIAFAIGLYRFLK